MWLGMRHAWLNLWEKHMITDMINQEIVTAVRVPGGRKGTGTPVHIFSSSPLHNHGRVGRATLDQHHKCSATRGRAFSRKSCDCLARARARGEPTACVK